MLYPFENSLAFAQLQDREDELNHLRKRFFIPQADEKEVIYFTGNSLGLQPKTARNFVEEEMLAWEQWGVEGHFEAKNPWFTYHHLLKKGLAHLTGAMENEVTAMNSLSNNLHLLLVSFYRPTQKRYKILMEAQAFPSDQYVVESQVIYHGFDPEEAIVELQPRKGEFTIRTEDVEKIIDELGGDLALVMLGGVNYYSGQAFEMEKITRAAHRVGAMAGYDLAHAIGNIQLILHDWEVDFACWCSYKYLNSSPGGVAGIFVHQKHHPNNQPPLFAGWWGYEEKTRFLMQKGFQPEKNVDAWQLSNVPILLMAVHRASLEIFEEAGIGRLRKKSEKLTAFLEFILLQISKELGFPLQIITPGDPAQRGCQLSLVTGSKGRLLYEALKKRNICIDWREPDVIRLAPVPLYNTFEELFLFGERFKESVLELRQKEATL